MTKVTVMTDGVNELAVEMLETDAEVRGAASVRCLLNGIAALFENEEDAQAFRQHCLTHERHRGKLANLSIGEA